jgi:filamentous hemagglutinin family protein
LPIVFSPEKEHYHAPSCCDHKLIGNGVSAMRKKNTNEQLHTQPQFRLKPVYAAVLLAVAVQTAQANPIGGTVAAGQASFATVGNTLNVTNTPGTIINWQGFSIGANEITHFVQQSASSAVLNRVISNNPSSILGTLQSNGRVFLINPGGIVFGAGATVDVAGMVASTLNLSNADFLAGRNHFTQVPGAANVSSANVSNAGNITAQNGGQIYLIAPDVENTGVITAPDGEILLAAGHSVDLVSTTNPNLRVSITAPAGDATNVGQLIAQSGSLGLFGTVVRNSGTVSADSATMQGGKIVFKASLRVEAGGTITANGTNGGSVDVSAAHSLDPNAPGVVIQTGSIAANGMAGAGGAVSLSGDSILSAAAINADGTTAGGRISVQANNRAISTVAAQYTADSTLGAGGDILVSADVSNYTSGSYSATGTTGGNLTLAGNEIKLAGAQLDASGTNGGGNIYIGGLMHGAAGFSAQGIALTNATNVLTNSATSLKANALQTGNGGEVVLWSDQAMSFKGNISAKGGVLGGNGGMAEVSGLTSMGYYGLTNLSAPAGLNGTLLLDPKNITIVFGALTGGAGGPSVLELIDPHPGAGYGFGGSMTELANGNIAIASPSDGFVAANAGAVFLYSPTGVLQTMLTGTTANDQVGSGGIKAVGVSNFVVASPWWDNTAAGLVADVGAVTWVNGTTGLTGAVSGSNSLVGSTASDQVGYGNYGSDGITVLVNGNYVVASPRWNNGAATWAGAVTWGDGTAGTVGAVTAANSLVGSLINDTVGGGNIAGSYGNGGVTALTNGNYVVTSPMWGGAAFDGSGAATWGNGATAGARLVGTISLANSLLGIGATDNVGNGGITALTNGNYVVSSNVYGSYAFQGGATTWGNGLGGTVGYVTNVNSLVGQTSGDMVGKTVTALTNGNYVVASPYWGSSDVGAVTWGNGLGGTTSWVTSSNSLVGTNASDYVGGGLNYTGGVTALSNGNYVVGSPNWHNGGVSLAGAVTWGNGTTGTVGIVGSGNSLTGSVAYDLLGISGSVTALAGNGNYVVGSYTWNGYRGASTWMDGATGLAGDGTLVISTANSLVGSTPYDSVGFRTTALSNGNYVVDSPYWTNGAATSAGAVTWGDGATTGIRLVGTVSSANSLVGSQMNDYVGSGGVKALSNGNYVVDSYQWNNGAVTSAGAVTWVNGTTGQVSDYVANGNTNVVSVTNSLVGSTANDRVGYGGITELGNFNYAVGSPFWNNGAATSAGAVTWANSLGATVGAVSASNSLLGSTASENLGTYVVALKQGANLGNAYVGSSGAANVALAGAGRAFILGAPVAGTTATSTLFTDTPATDVTIGAGNIAATLNLGTNVLLQANNDITQNTGAGITATGSGNLTLQAGRSVVLGDVIHIGGALDITANDAGITAAEKAAIAANRSAGTAVLDTSLATITAGSINFTNSGGDILAGAITANTGALAATGGVTINGNVSVGAVAVSANTFTLSGGTWNQVSATLPGFTVNDFSITGGTFIRALGGNGSIANPYRLADIYGVQGMDSAGMLGNSYVLANNIDAAGTVNWNAGAGFVPVGNINTPFTGQFDGLNHTISNLTTINIAQYEGLFGVVGVGGIVSNVGLIGSSVIGACSDCSGVTGALAGYNQGTISNSYASNGSVSVGSKIGGLVGWNAGAIINTYASGGTVGGGDNLTSGIGGLVGYNIGSIANSYASNSVSVVLGTSSTVPVGGLVGYNDSYGGAVVSASFWNTTTAGASASLIAGASVPLITGTGVSFGIGLDHTTASGSTDIGTDIGATGLTSAGMMTMANFTNAGWDNIANTIGAGKTWTIFEGVTMPLLTSFLTETITVPIVPNVIDEIVDITNQNHKKPEDVLAGDIPTGEGGNTSTLPVCN